MEYGSRFFKCVECETLVEALNPQCCDELMCCGKPMLMMRADTDETLAEKHKPIIKRENGCMTVCVGRVLHPMSNEHSILWIEIKGKNECRRVHLKKGDDPIVIFRGVDDGIRYKVYAYCNKHGLWCAQA